MRDLYAANFTKGRVDNTFHRVELGAENQRGGPSDDADSDNDHECNNCAFADEQLRRDLVPFNVQATGNDIVVTYVLHQEGNMFETDGPGLDIYSSGMPAENRSRYMAS